MTISKKVKKTVIVNHPDGMEVYKVGGTMSMYGERTASTVKDIVVGVDNILSIYFEEGSPVSRMVISNTPFRYYEYSEGTEA